MSAPAEYSARPDGGAAWLQSAGIATGFSPLGVRVADLLGDLFDGIYHLPSRTLARVVWSETHHLRIAVSSHRFATYDFDGLTRLVFLAHDYALRASVEGGGPRRLALMFWPRRRDGKLSERHPGLEGAVASHRRIFGPSTIVAHVDASEQPAPPVEYFVAVPGVAE